MDTRFPVNAHVHELPIMSFTLNNVYDALVQNLYGTVDEVLLPAVADPVAGQSHGAPYFDGMGWQVLDADLQAYRPASVVVGNTILKSSPTSNRVQYLQQKTGTVALLDDVYGIAGTVTLQDGLVNVDWDVSKNFRVVLTGSRQSSFYMSHSRPGMELKLMVTNSGTNQTIATWDSAIKWPGGSAPAMPASTPGAAKSLIVTMRNIGGTIYAESTTHEHTPITDVSPVSSYPTGGIGQHD